VSRVRYEKHDRIARVTLCRPEAMNAIDRTMHDRLIEVWRDFEADPAVDIAILTGEGHEAFCAGADLKDFIPAFLEMTPRDLRDGIRQGLGGITRGLHRVYKPIIGAVNGWALAGGFELALACDLRVASENAVFGSFELKRGFHHGDGGIVRLVASVGMARTFDIVFTGREVSADEALRIGLVSEVVPSDRLMPTAERYAATLLTYSQAAVRSAKETILEVVGRTLDDALRVEAQYGYTSGDPDDVRRRLEEFFKSRGERLP
jgi:enoyl-CoA hydratase/carnithine racemase